ncbi:hypothetical protein QBZ16_000609 [Prototheca wickerhamii]|uniref:Uncharacterized protein n=1 Tax=Prototheca wickerhamii TaxID=3111 RepID=A0AAD9INF8_PROWI|nr:hypothetical protein QBZ16_000609 [Prototheca wickerhamii]
MARSRHRGGTQPNLREADSLEDRGSGRRKHRGKARQNRRQLLDQLSDEIQITDLSWEGVRTGSALPADLRVGGSSAGGEDTASSEQPASLEGNAGSGANDDMVPPSARAQHANIPSTSARLDELIAAQGPSGSAAEARKRYGSAAVLAYAAARLPACYAALRHTLGETASLLGPNWRPRTMLDFGAGPGTAALAAQDVWPADGGAPALRITAVDASESMAALGRQLQEGRGEQVWWTPRLDAARRGVDLVTAGYVLCELSSAEERARVVAELWARVRPGGVLLLVEPGTPAGSHNILAARAQVLGLGGAKRSPRGGPEDSTPSPNAPLAEPDRQAYVVAPCPHDGACPLQGREIWCHFSQRFQRSAAQRGMPALDADIPLAEDVAAAYRQLPPDQVPRRARKQMGLAPLESSPGPSQAQEPQEALDDLALFELAQSRGLLDDLDEETRALLLESLGEDEDLLDEVLAPEAAENELRESAQESPTDTTSTEDEADPSSLLSEDAQRALAAQAAQQWSRVVRPPLKKAKHVVVDLCSAADEAAGRGELVRQVVARLGSERRLGGRGAYRLARELRWGDLWPHHYQANLPSTTR